MNPRAATPATTFRSGGVGDRAYMVDLAEKTFVDFGDYRVIIDQWLDMPRVHSLVLVENTDRIGFALVARHRRLGFFRPVMAELVAIVVEPEERGRGLGALLLAGAEDVAREWKAREMCLHTAVENVAARAFFAAAGYHELAGGVSSYPNGQPALEWRRSLG